MWQKEILNRCFNEGSDARLRGEPLTACPYYGSDQRDYYRMGWMDVEMNWGEKSMYPVKPLPKVNGMFAEIKAVAR